MWMVVVLVVGGLLTARLFVWPDVRGPRHADGVVVLSGDFGDRLAKGLALVRAGVAPTLVLDGRPDFPAVSQLCQSAEPFEVVCLRPEPDSTRSEAQAVGRLAADRRWATVVVVTNRSHATRAQVLFDRCVAGHVAVVGTDPPYGRRMAVGAVLHEWLGLLDALLLVRNC
jgi:uncharacterized SAM-binding protein YcdF (DUF218 family)